MPHRVGRLCLAWWRRQHWRARVAYALVAAGVAVAFVFVDRQGDHVSRLAAQNSDQIVRLDKTDAALRAAVARLATVAVGVCEFREGLNEGVTDAQARIRQTTTLLKENPEGLPSFGSLGTPKALRQSIADQRRTLDRLKRSRDALRVVQCTPPSPLTPRVGRAAR